MSSFHFWVWIIPTICSYYIWISDWGFKRYSYFGRALELLCLFPHIQIVTAFVFWENCWYKHTDLVFLVGVTVLWSLKPWRILKAWAPNRSTSEWRMGGNVTTCVSWFGGGLGVLIRPLSEMEWNALAAPGLIVRVCLTAHLLCY